MKEKTLCFLIKSDGGGNKQICLGFKKRGFGQGLYAGIGGKVGDKKEETVEEAMVREVKEEIGVETKNFFKIGEITFLFPDKEGWDQLVHVFITKDWVGKLEESEEMKPSWFDEKSVPYSQMWDDVQYYLPKIFSEEKFKATFIYDQDLKVKEYKFTTL
jgi:8-oxo-dGTP diphosphatase